MTSGTSCVIALTKEGNTEDVFNEWRKDVGSTNLEEARKNLDSLRAQYATDKIVNAIHGSDSHESSLKYIIKLNTVFKKI